MGVEGLDGWGWVGNGTRPSSVTNRGSKIGAVADTGRNATGKRPVELVRRACIKPGYTPPCSGVHGPAKARR